jgi:hypothetical protein
VAVASEGAPIGRSKMAKDSNQNDRKRSRWKRRKAVFAFIGIKFSSIILYILMLIRRIKYKLIIKLIAEDSSRE